jgi:hypothetical protein
MITMKRVLEVLQAALLALVFGPGFAFRRD